MVFAGLVVVSLAIELVQRRYGLGTADPADLLANTVGAGIGVLTGVMARRAGTMHNAPIVDAEAN
jgi:glycopeptide antibiotics resistance protein